MKDELEQLRDIQLPPEIGWWPPAPGWWLVSLLLLGALALLVWWGLRRHRRQRPLREALALLAKIERDYQQHQDGSRLAQELSALLKRVALSLKGRDQVAAVGGERFLVLLDDLAGRKLFQSELGWSFLAANYRPGADVDGVALIQLGRRWLRLVRHV